MQEIDLFIFDLDGTLVDTRLDLATSINHTREAFGLPAQTLEETMKYVGDGIRKLLQRSLPNASEATVEEALSTFRTHYRVHLLDQSRFYPGVDEVLSHFSHKHCAVVSNKPVEFTRAILDGLGVTDSFVEILGGDSVAALKPDPLPIRHVVEKVGVHPGKSVVVGDSPSDIQAGEGAGTLTCAVTYGFRSRELLEAAQPDTIIDSFSELMNLYE